jgi:phage gp46-like protein
MLALSYDKAAGECDLIIADGELQEGGDLLTAMILSLFVDARVSEGELPDQVDRGGWWGAAYAEDPSDAEGSRLWTLPIRGGATPLRAREAEDYARQALRWLLEDGVCTSVTAAAAVTQPGVVALTVRAVAAEDQRETLLTVVVT